MVGIWKTPGVWAFVGVAFLNAFVDLGHKIVIQNTLFKIYDGDQLVILTAIVNGLILLPFILMFRPAGMLSDYWHKQRVMRTCAWVSVFATSCILLFYALGLFWAAFAMTFLMALQSAFYSPAKLGYIRGLFGTANLAQANGMVQAVGIIAILFGTLVFSGLFEWQLAKRGADMVLSESSIIYLMVPLAVCLIAGAVCELILAYRLPRIQQTTQPITKQACLSCLSPSKGMNEVKQLLGRTGIALSVLGISLFWAVGQVILAAFPAFAKAQTATDNTLLIQAVIALAGVGIAVGSSLAGRISKGYIETGLIPVGACGIAVGLLLLPHMSSLAWMGVAYFFIGLAGGLFIIPLYALIQFYANPEQLGKTLAANNLFQNLAMLSMLLMTIGFSYMGWSSQQLLIAVSLLATLGGLYTVYKLPQSLIRFVLAIAFKQHYSVAVEGVKHIPQQGGVLLLGNHVSWIDWAIIQIACPRPVRFVMAKKIYERRSLNWFLRHFDIVPIERGKGSQHVLEQVAEVLDAGFVVCLFPEGALTRDGQLAPFKTGYQRALMATKTKVAVVPFVLRGLWGSQWSHYDGVPGVSQITFSSRDVSVHFDACQPKDISAIELHERIQSTLHRLDSEPAK